MYDAFISYRRKNGFATAKLIRELLKAKGVTAYMDLDELRNGKFDEKLIDAINTCPSFILVLPPKSLDNCCKKDDWLAKEVEAAVDSKRNIIPVLCDGFEWPKEWKANTPEKIKDISHIHSVEMSAQYVDAMIDRIIDRIKGDNASKNSNDELETFFRNRMSHIDKIESVDLAFHSGSTWLENIDRLEILKELIERGKKLRIITNSPETVEPMAKHMRHKMKEYMTFDKANRRWRDFDDKYNNVEVRVSDIPLLRVYYSLNMENELDSVLRVKYYTYANAELSKNYSHNFEPGDSCYDLYKREFEFLWNNAKPKGEKTE